MGERLGVPESALLAALPHGSAASRVLDIVAAGGSVGSFIETAGEFVGKDVAVVRGIAAELGSDLGVLDDVIDAAVTGCEMRSFRSATNASTVSVTVEHSVVTVSAAHSGAEEGAMTKPKVVFDPYSEEYFTNPFDIYRRMREDAPLYYDEKEDFYALTRHEDVAAALKDFETYSSSSWLRPGDGAQGHIRRAEVDHLHGSAGAPPYAQPAQQGVHPAGHSSPSPRPSTR